MANQAKQAKSEEKRESGLPGGGQGRRDEVGESGIYPVSESDRAAPDATVRDGASFGQGDRGAEGYNDAGDSGVILLNEELDEAKKEGRD